MCLRTAGLPHTLGRWHSWSGRGGRGGRGQTSPPPLLILLKGGRAGASGRQGGRPLLHRTGSHSPASPPQRSQGPSGEPGSSPRPGGLGVCFQEGPAPNAFLMQTEASGHWPQGHPGKGLPPAGLRLPRRLLPLPPACLVGAGLALPAPAACCLFPPGPALAMVLTAGSWGDTDGPAACPSPPFPWDPPCHSDGVGLGWLAELQEGAGLRCSQGVGDTVTGSPQIPQAAFPVKATAACGETQQGGQAMMNAPAPPLPSRVPEHARPASALPRPRTRPPQRARPASAVQRPRTRPPRLGRPGYPVPCPSIAVCPSETASERAALSAL